MYDDPLPAESYILQCFQNPRVAKIVTGWRVDPSRLRAIVLNNLREMGITFVAKNQRKTVLETVILCLKKSQEIKTLLKKAESEEHERRRSRHANV